MLKKHNKKKNFNRNKTNLKLKKINRSFTKKTSVSQPKFY